MRILFLTSRFPKASEHFTLEKELVHAFALDGHQCTVANILEKKNGSKSFVEKMKVGKTNIELLHIRTGNLFNNVTFLQKKLTVLSLPYVIPKVIKQFLPVHTFDLIIAYGPYLCNAKIIKSLKAYYECKAILVQWDIFPQNAYDLGILKNKFIFKFLKFQQRQKFQLYDLILCNSSGNIQYFTKHFPLETRNKLYLFHNCESPKSHKDSFSSEDKQSIRIKYGLASDSNLLIFGGNIGIPQELENIINIAQKLSHTKNEFIISGQGTEAAKIKKLSSLCSNIKFIDFLPSKDYEELLQCCDYGLISLSAKFTVPNFPAKVSSYLKLGIPIFACIDNAAFDDLGQFIASHNIGFSVRAENYDTVIDQIEEFLADQNLRQTQSNQAKKIFDEYFNINNMYLKLIAQIQKTV